MPETPKREASAPEPLAPKGDGGNEAVVEAMRSPQDACPRVPAYGPWRGRLLAHGDLPRRAVS